MNKTSKIIISLLLIIVVILAVWAVYEYLSIQKLSATEPALTEPIKVGAVFPMTGDAANYGQTGKKGADLAVEKAKQEYGVDLQMIYEDDKLDLKTGVAALQKLIDIDSANFVLGYYSGSTLAMCPITEENHVIFLTSGSNSDITNCGDYTFRIFPSDAYQGKELANKIYDQGYKKVAVFYINGDYGVGLKNEFVNNYKGEIVALEAHQVGSKDFNTQLLKIKAAQPEAIVLISHLAEGSAMLKQRVEVGLEQPIFCSEALKDQQLIKDTPAEALKNVYLIFVSQYEGQEFQEYRQAHLDTYGVEYGAFSDYVYDHILVLANAISKCDDANDIECIKNEIYKTDMIGATGRIQYDENGDITGKPYSLYKIENGEYILAD